MEKAILCADMVVWNEEQLPFKVLMIYRKRPPYEGM